jgi:hypothetical protein
MTMSKTYEVGELVQVQICDNEWTDSVVDSVTSEGSMTRIRGSSAGIGWGFFAGGFSIRKHPVRQYKTGDLVEVMENGVFRTATVTRVTIDGRVSFRFDNGFGWMVDSKDVATHVRRVDDGHARYGVCPCGGSMRPTGMGEVSGSVPSKCAAICTKCERYRGPFGAWTPGQWWRIEDRVTGPAWCTAAMPPPYTADGILAGASLNLPPPLPPMPCVRQSLDPLDAKYDDVTLRTLLARDFNNQRDALGVSNLGGVLTPSQRAAVSAHWSAELRARVATAKERERNVVTYCDVDAEE